MMGRLPSILFVCTANQCRSPVASALFRENLKEAGLEDDFRVGSAGTWGDDGLPAARLAVRVLLDRGVDLSQHLSRIVTHELLAEQDLILVMEEGHKEALQVEFPDVAGRIRVLATFAGVPCEIVDPHSSDRQEYSLMVDELAGLVEKAAKRILGSTLGDSED